MNKLSILVILASFSSIIANAQYVDKLIKEADDAIYEERFAEAYEKYNYVSHLHPEEKSILYPMEVSYLLSEGRGKPVDRLLALGQKYGKLDPYYHFYLGRIYLTQYDFSKAKEHLTIFLRSKSDKNPIIVQESKDLITYSTQAQLAYENPGNWKIEKLPQPVNGDFSDLSPSFFAGHNELLFISSRPTEPIYEEDQYHVFHSYKTENGSWSEPTYLENFGDFTFLNAKIEVVSADGKAFVYKDQSGGNLYYSEEVENNNWQDLKEFSTNLKSRHVESHFFIDDSEKTVIFAKEEDGQVDLYQTSLDAGTGQWSDPKEVNINTKYNEDSPYLSHDGKYLYFSSDRPESIGGYDVFRSAWNAVSNSWGTPENLGYPINTIDDDIHFELNEDNQSGYFSSNRLHSHGDFDIFFFQYDENKVFTGITPSNESKIPADKG